MATTRSGYFIIVLPAAARDTFQALAGDLIIRQMVVSKSFL
jgi:hypothetical protein